MITSKSRIHVTSICTRYSDKLNQDLQQLHMFMRYREYPDPRQFSLCIHLNARLETQPFSVPIDPVNDLVLTNERFYGICCVLSLIPELEAQQAYLATQFDEIIYYD